MDTVKHMNAHAYTRSSTNPYIHTRSHASDLGDVLSIEVVFPLRDLAVSLEHSLLVERNEIIKGGKGFPFLSLPLFLLLYLQAASCRCELNVDAASGALQQACGGTAWI